MPGFVPWLLLGLTLVGTAALPAACCLRLPLIGTLLAAYLLAVAEIVLTTELLSTVHAVGRTGYLATGGPLAALAVAVWWRHGWPRPALGVPRAVLNRHPIVAALAVAVGLGVAYQLFLVLTVPPNTWDGLSYHLTRAADWLQQDAVGWVPAATIRVNVFPVNGEIQMLWTFALAGTDVAAALPQFLAELATIVAVAGIARRLGFGRAPATYAALIFATLAEVVLQSTSTQNDLDVTAPITAAAYFILGRTRRDLWLAAAAIGIAVGTKLTAIFALPCLALIAFVVLDRRQRLTLAAAAAAGVAALASPTYVRNVVHTGSPFGRGPEITAFKPRRTVAGTVSTAARIGWRFVDFTGLRTGAGADDAVARAGSAVFGGLHIPENPSSSTFAPFTTDPTATPDEDRAFFGPLGALVILPIALVTLVGGLMRRVRREDAALAASLPLFLIALALAYRYDLWLGRFMVVPVALITPLVARLYSWRIVSALGAVIAAATLQATLMTNTLKPFALHPWTMNRAAVQTLERPEIAATIQAIDADVPAGRIGYAFGTDDWTYLLFGESFQRHPVLVQRSKPLADATAKHLEWLVVSRRIHGNRQWQVVHRGSWTLLRARSAN